MARRQGDVMDWHKESEHLGLTWLVFSISAATFVTPAVSAGEDLY